jgi:hypothetical protein
MRDCATCNEAVSVVCSEGGVKKGEFRETYRCARGHVGTVKGTAEADPIEWTRTGPVFVEA